MSLQGPKGKKGAKPSKKDLDGVRSGAIGMKQYEIVKKWLKLLLKVRWMQLKNF